LASFREEVDEVTAFRAEIADTETAGKRRYV
jgi:hypothetical protein